MSCTAPAPTNTPQSTVAADAPLLLLCVLLSCRSCTLTGALLLGPSRTRLMPLLKVMVSGGSASARVCTAGGQGVSKACQGGQEKAIGRLVQTQDSGISCSTTGMQQ